MKTLVVCSGGLDSVTLAYKVAKESNLAGLIAFNYGQRHKKELGFAKLCAEALDVSYNIIDISSVGALLSGSALTGDIAVPDGHYEEESMKATVVPNRNAIMMTIAYGVASARDMQAVAIAVHGGDHFIYPDCRPDFIKSFEQMQNYALDGMGKIKLSTPFLEMSKADIVNTGVLLDVPFIDTWSCYKGKENHCGRCGTCVERREAFDLARVKDPTYYEDTEFWKSACNV